MSHKPLTISQLRDLINEGEIQDPIVFLESIMSGQDPRELSSIYSLIEDIDDLTDGDISKEDWAEIQDHVYSRYKYQSVPLAQSINASRTLAEYLHPKRKQVEIKGALDTGGSLTSTDLTPEEVDMFKERFNHEY